MPALAPVRTVAPAALPLTAAEAAGAKAQARVSHSSEDDLITAYVTAATEYLDGWSGVLGRCLITQTWRQDFAGFGDKLRLPLAPVASITSITYYDEDNVQQTLGASIYALHTDVLGPFVELAPDKSWPSVYARTAAVSVTFVAGYGASGSSVPEPLRQAIRFMSAHWFDEREGKAEDQAAVRALIAPYRRATV